MHGMLSAADFKPVSLEDQDLFRRHYERFPQVHSDNTFTNMVCWNHYAHYKYAYLEDNIIISSIIGGKTIYRLPIGPHSPELLEDLFRLAAGSGDNNSHPIEILGSQSKEWIASLYPGLSIYPERNYFDYVYLSSDLAGLAGKNYATIRRQLHQFEKNCSPFVEPITEGIIRDVYEFLDQWCEWKDCDSETMLSNEKEAIIFALDHFSELGLMGLAINVKDKIGAISIFEGLNRDTALVHFEKGLMDCKGIYRAINAQTAKLLEKDYAYINRESDMGVEGIREAKTRYHPDHMVEVYFLDGDELRNLART
jgi:uncharacterized protein